MRLRTQLLLVSLVLLGIPWAGYSFLNANEQALRELQQRGLQATGKALATGLENRLDLLYTDQRRAQEPVSDKSLQATPLSNRPVIDGYFDEWQRVPRRQFGSQRRPISIATGEHGNSLYLAIAITDFSKRYDASLGRQSPSGDRLVLTTWIAGQRQQYVISTAAPGTVRGQVVGRQLLAAAPQSIRGLWVDVADGYQLELSLPLSTASQRLGVHYIDADEGGISTRGNIDPLAMAAPPWLITTPKALRALIAKFNAGDQQVRIFDRWGWELAASVNEGTDVPPAEAHVITRWLYRSLLADPTTKSPPSLSSSLRVEGGDVARALRSQSSHSLAWSNDQLMARFATPILGPDGVAGVVLIEQPRERYLSLTDSAFEGLVLKGSVIIGFIILALLSFASLLSLRIMRLQSALAQATPPNLSASIFGDELDSLAAQFATLLKEQQRLEGYLRALPNALAHEIRTPVAVIGSTLEQFSSVESQAERETLLARAQAGLGRLSSMLNAMNEASRLEHALGDERRETIDLVALLRELADAYTHSFNNTCFEITTDNTAAPARVAPDLIVQAFDKLVANAVSFATPNTPVVLRCVRRGLWWRLSVANSGPTLPADISDLFAPMQSMRAHHNREHGHLGLGLYVVSLIARQHGGEPWARNTNHPAGAEVGFTVRAD